MHILAETLGLCEKRGVMKISAHIFFYYGAFP